MKRALEYAAARIGLASLQWTPMPLARTLSRLYVRMLDRAVPRLRRTAYQNLQFALPGADHRRITDGVFDSIARVLLALARFPRIRRENVDEWIRYEGLEYFHAAKLRGRGILFATAHLGNWELSAFAHGLMTEPMHVVVRPLDNGAVDRVIEKRRRLSNNQVISKKDAARNIVRALRRNEAVGILIDQNVSPEEGVFVDFFGVPACAGTAFARIAWRTGAAVIPGFALWCEAEHRHILRFHPPVQMSGDEAADTARIHAALESVIREYPDQWLWIHRRWKTRPTGPKSLVSYKD